MKCCSEAILAIHALNLPACLSPTATKLICVSHTFLTLSPKEDKNVKHKKAFTVIAKIESFDFAQDKSWSTLPVSLTLLVVLQTC